MRAVWSRYAFLNRHVCVCVCVYVCVCVCMYFGRWLWAGSGGNLSSLPLECPVNNLNSKATLSMFTLGSGNEWLVSSNGDALILDTLSTLALYFADHHHDCSWDNDLQWQQQ